MVVQPALLHTTRRVGGPNLPSMDQESCPSIDFAAQCRINPITNLKTPNGLFVHSTRLGASPVPSAEAMFIATKFFPDRRPTKMWLLLPVREVSHVVLIPV